MSQEPVRSQREGDATSNMLGVLLGGVAIGFLLGALLGPAVMRTAGEYGARRQPSAATGPSPFSGPLGTEGGGFDGEPLYEPE